MATIHTVSQVTAHIKYLFADDEVLRDVWIAGEVSNFKQASSGHCYFTLKDSNSCIRSVIWRTQASGLTLPREGDAVVAHGYVSVYEPRGDYQFYIDHLQPGGTGWLWQEFQRLKTRLEAEGLFDEGRKRPVPSLPQRLGVVTSASGAALRDILRTLSRRYPLVEVLLAPATVQGDQAPLSIVNALAALNLWAVQGERLDAIILARGGGSIEELWAFNDERVARAIAASAVPVIAGVGHETDFTIADFVADVRAPTPTGAAMADVPEAGSLAASVAGLFAAAHEQVEGRLHESRRDLQYLHSRLEQLSPAQHVTQSRQRVDELQRRAAGAAERLLTRWRERLESRRQYLSAMHPAQVLARGYAVVTAQDGSVVRSKTQVAASEDVTVQVSDGSFTATVRSTGD
jgi:exodeoxyribonuclease VII large subunit